MVHISHYWIFLEGMKLSYISLSFIFCLLPLASTTCIGTDPFYGNLCLGVSGESQVFLMADQQIEVLPYTTHCLNFAFSSLLRRGKVSNNGKRNVFIIQKGKIILKL